MNLSAVKTDIERLASRRCPADSEGLFQEMSTEVAH